MSKSLHIICGKCGNGEPNNFGIKVENNPEEDRPDVFITCSNCSTLTEIGESL